MELKYTFDNPGLHEVFFDFAFVSNPTKIYEVPDFLLDVQRPNGYSTGQVLTVILISFVMGLAAGWFIKRLVD